MGPYSTSAMAEDVIVLLDFVGWTKSRSVHVVGLSMGGMIALELTHRIPERFISLSLVVTTAGGLPIFNIPPWFGLKNILRYGAQRGVLHNEHSENGITRMPFIEDLKRRTPMVMEVCFNSSWLDAKTENDPEGRTNP
ncbi:hypothetical protein H4582DRAFT_276420 [Lactarius indigo]|nr:hypothetical protein H4582DRAFT_276420 [Lactarius indigo]